MKPADVEAPALDARAPKVQASVCWKLQSAHVGVCHLRFDAGLIAGDRPVQAPQESGKPAAALSFAAELEGKMAAIADDPSTVQPTIVASA